MWLLIPILLLLIAVFLVTSLFAGIFGLIGVAWPWLLIGLGVWMFWHEDGRHRRHRRGRAPVVQLKRDGRARPVVAAAASARSGVAASGPRPMRQTELPIDVQVKVEQIRRKVDTLLGFADRFPPFSQDLYLVRQTATDYLPRTLNAYLAMPSLTADKPLSPDGKTAHQELTSQLDLLDAKLDDIAQDLQRQDADRLLANRRFLESRFGTRDGGLDPDHPEPAATAHGEVA